MEPPIFFTFSREHEMDWKDVGAIVAKAAPVVGSVLGGPVGLIAGAAGSLLSEALGVDSEPDAVMQAIKQDPEALLKIKQIESENKARLLAWQEKQLDAEVADRKSARSRDVAINKARGSNLRGDILAWAAIGGLVALIYTLLFVDVPDGPARDVLLLLSGGLVTIVKDVYGFEFGSSRGSKEKDIFAGGRSNG